MRKNCHFHPWVVWVLSTRGAWDHEILCRSGNISGTKGLIILLRAEIGESLNMFTQQRKQGRVLGSGNSICKGPVAKAEGECVWEEGWHVAAGRREGGWRDMIPRSRGGVRGRETNFTRASGPGCSVESASFDFLVPGPDSLRLGWT